MEYLIRSRKPKVIHIWNGKDTACRLYSTGGLVKDRYIALSNPPNLPVCTMCKGATCVPTVKPNQSSMMLDVSDVAPENLPAYLENAKHRKPFWLR